MNKVTEKRPDTKKIIIFFVRLIVVSLILYTVWMLIGKYLYTLLIANAAKPFVALTGKPLDMGMAMNASEEISLNPVVYVSLVLAVTGVQWKKRIKPASLGILILTIANIVIVFMSFLSYYTRDKQLSDQLWTGTEFLNLTINFFLPILLWALLMPKGDLLPVSSSSD